MYQQNIPFLPQQSPMQGVTRMPAPTGSSANYMQGAAQNRLAQQQLEEQKKQQQQQMYFQLANTIFGGLNSVGGLMGGIGSLGGKSAPPSPTSAQGQMNQMARMF